MINNPQLSSEVPLTQQESKYMVFVVEDDNGMRDSIGAMLEGESIKHKLFASPEEFLTEFDDTPGCLVFDLCLPGMDGVELYRMLREKGVRLPCVMISGNANIKNAVESMKLGVVDFLEKPFRSQTLIDCIAKSIKIVAENEDTISRFKSLTPREREFVEHIREGSSVKLISQELGIKPKTGHIHRHSIHLKLGVSSDVELLNKLRRAGIQATKN